MAANPNVPTLYERLAEIGIVPGGDTRDPWEEVVLPLQTIQFDRVSDGTGGYQRDPNPAWVTHLAEHWDPLQADPPLVNWRESGEFFSFEGQHRILGKLQRDGDLATLTCRLFYGLTREQEAYLFNTQRNIQKLNPIDIFHAGVSAREEPYITIKAIVEATGWQIWERKKQDGIHAVAALIRLYAHYRPGLLRETLVLLRAAFPAETMPSSAILRGFGLFHSWYAEDYDAPTLIKRLRALGLPGLRALAETRRLAERAKADEAVGMALVTEYNDAIRRSRTLEPLADWRTKARTRKNAGKPKGPYAL